MDFSSLGGGSSSGPIALDLNKSISLDLTKAAGKPLNEVKVSLAWDPVRSGQDVDLDLSAFALHNGKVKSVQDVLFYNTPSDSPFLYFASHSSDSRDGSEADGDDADEWIQIDLKQVPADINRIVFLVTIHEAQSRQQTFGLVRSLVYISDGEGKRLATYRLSQDYSTDIAIIIGEVQRQGSSWIFKGEGEGKFADLNGLLSLYV